MTTMAPIAFELALRTVSEANRHEHWRVRQKRAKAHRHAAWAAMSLAPKVTLERPLRVTLTRVGPRDLDSDNLPVSMKHVRDGIADALGIDDRDPRVSWHYAQARGPSPKHYAVRVVIAEETLARSA
jgi:hypothetical protein